MIMSAQCPSLPLPQKIYLSRQLNLDSMMRVTVCDKGSVCVPCNVQNAKAYLAGCQVAKCSTGWEVSEDKAKCEATGAKCTSDGAKICANCKSGFKRVSEGLCPVGDCRCLFVSTKISRFKITQFEDMFKIFLHAL